MRVGSSRWYIPAIRGSKIGYTNIARYTYVCLAEENGVRLICVTMQSQLKPDKYNDVRTLLDYAFARYTGYTDIPAQGLTAALPSAPGTRLLLADGLTAADVSVTLELPEQYILGTKPEVYAVYTVNGQDKQESASVRVPATITGLQEVLDANVGVQPGGSTGLSVKKIVALLLAVSLGGTVIAAGAAFLVVKLRARTKKKARH